MYAVRLPAGDVPADPSDSDALTGIFPCQVDLEDAIAEAERQIGSGPDDEEEDEAENDL